MLGFGAARGLWRRSAKEPELIVNLTEEVARIVSDGVASLPPPRKFARIERRHLRAFNRRLQGEFRKPFQELDGFIGLAAHWSTDFHAVASTTSEEFRAPAYFVVLHYMRALLTMRETAALLKSGYVFGALSRVRHLFETEVVLALLIDNPDTFRDPDFMHLLVSHDELLRAREMLHASNTEVPLGWEVYRFSGADLAWAEEVVERERQGRTTSEFKKFSSDYGWALAIPGVTNTSMRDLANAADLGIWHPFYKYLSNHTHGNHRGAAMNEFVYRGEQRFYNGPTNMGFVDPVQIMCLSAARMTAGITRWLTDTPILVGDADGNMVDEEVQTQLNLLGFSAAMVERSVKIIDSFARVEGEITDRDPDLPHDT
jgi:hypothetical protein